MHHINAGITFYDIQRLIYYQLSYCDAGRTHFTDIDSNEQFQTNVGEFLVYFPIYTVLAIKLYFIFYWFLDYLLI